MADWVPLDDYARAHHLTADAVWAFIRDSRLAHREMDGAHFVQEREASRGNEALVPSGYAEKAMASLLRLHDELMVEKEAKVSLLKTLMEKEQALAELKGYVKLLEERMARPPVERPGAAQTERSEIREARPQVAAPPQSAAVPPQKEIPAAPPQRPGPAPEVKRAAPQARPAAPATPVRPEGWRQW